MPILLITLNKEYYTEVNFLLLDELKTRKFFRKDIKMIIYILSEE
jgi:hypothetical protein